ncbi:MAG: DoxX family protein [Ekhidna sp.]
MNNATTQSLETIDQAIAKHMNKWGVPLIKFSFALIFIWFGILKPFGWSAAIPIVKSTVAWLPFFKSITWVHIIGWWEVLIGILFLFRGTIRIAVFLLFLQMSGTFMPMVFLPDVVYQDGNVLLPTMEGQYIIKNIMIISAALVVGGKFYIRNKEAKK